MKLLELALSLAYSAKVNYTDVFGQVRMWDCIIYQYLKSHIVIIPPKKPSNKGTQYAGAYVKEPITGMHDWVVSFDLVFTRTLSCSIILVPKLKLRPTIRTSLVLELIIFSSQPQNYTGVRVMINSKIGKQKDFSIAANGTIYRRDRKGFLPSLMEKMYKERKLFKKKMIECQKNLKNYRRKI